MLRKARDVAIVEIPEHGDDRSAAMVRVADVAAWLARNGVIATARVPEAAANEPAAIQLERIAGDVGAGLIVAGAYGHSRFRELILGGVTEYLVTQSARSVLLSH
jgi:nucleotide-binding universal stress UspA family protein